jgi:hypothetical protein
MTAKDAWGIEFFLAVQSSPQKLTQKMPRAQPPLKYTRGH